MKPIYFLLMFLLAMILLISGCSPIGLYTDSRRFSSCESLGIISATGKSENEGISNLKEQALKLGGDSVYLRQNYKGELPISQTKDRDGQSMVTVSAEAFQCHT